MSAFRDNKSGCGLYCGKYGTSNALHSVELAIRVRHLCGSLLDVVVKFSQLR